DIDRACACAIVSDVHDVVLDPHVVSAFLRYFIFGNFPRVEDIGNVDDMDHPFGRDPRFIRKIELCRKHFIAEEDIVLVTEYRVGYCKPTWAVKFGVVESKLSEELGIFRTVALDAFSYIRDYE